MVYKEFTIIFKESSSDDDFVGTYTVAYENASFQATNQHMIIHLHKEDDDGKFYVEGHIFDLKMIKSYKGV